MAQVDKTIKLELKNGLQGRILFYRHCKKKNLRGNLNLVVNNRITKLEQDNDDQE